MTSTCDDVRSTPGGGLRRRDLLRLLGGAAAAAALLSACGPTAPTPATAQPGAAAQATSAPAAATRNTTSLRLAVPRTIPALDARLGGAGVEQLNVYMHLYDPLVDFDPKLTPCPRLAESWAAVDPSTWRFKLRQGVKFHNGEDFNAESVKWTIESFAQLDPPYQYASNWGAAWPPVATVESDYSVLIRTPKPQPVVPQLLSRVCMLPPKAASAPNFPDNPVGTGAYRLAQWDKGQQIVMEANSAYWGGAPKLGQLTWLGISDQTARLAGLQAGDLDLIWDVPYERIEEVQASPKFQVYEAPSLGLAFITFNFHNTSSPIADVRVRQALTYAIDQQELRDALLSGKGELSRGPAPLLALGAVDAGGFPRREVAMAQKLLAEAGHPTLNLDFIYSPGQFAKDLEVADRQLAGA